MNKITYINILKDALNNKLNLLDEILDETYIQEKCLLLEEVDIDGFNDAILRKESLISYLYKLDEGFDVVFERVGNIIKDNRYIYHEEIIQLQQLIRQIIEMSTLVEGKEKSNKEKLEHYLSSKKREVKNFKVSNYTVNNYYKSMSEGYHGESFFIDKKK